MVAIPWKFESSYAHHMKKSYGVVAQLIERYVRIVEVVGLSPISSTILRVSDALGGRPPKPIWQGRNIKKSWGYGGMVDAEDLKSFDHCDRVGSSPTIPTTDFHRSKARIENRVSRCSLTNSWNVFCFLRTAQADRKNKNFLFIARNSA